MLATWDQFDAQPGYWIKPAATTKQRKDLQPPAQRAGTTARSLRFVLRAAAIEF